MTMNNFKVRGHIVYGFRGSKSQERRLPVGNGKARLVEGATSHVDAVAKLLANFEANSANRGQHTNLRFEGTSYEVQAEGAAKILSAFQH